MSGLYAETAENWQDVVLRLIELRPENIAFYEMEVARRMVMKSGFGVRSEEMNHRYGERR